MPPPNGWSQYKVHIIHELERTNKELTMIDERLSKIERRLTILDTKVYVASFLFSVIFAGVFSLVMEKF